MHSEPVLEKDKDVNVVVLDQLRLTRILSEGDTVPLGQFQQKK